MGSCCCLGTPVDLSDPAVTAYIFTRQFVRHGAPLSYSSIMYRGGDRAVYVREGELHLGSHTGCMAGGYPLRSISSAEVVRGVTVQGHMPFTLNPGVRITGADGTVIWFSGAEGEVENFVQQVNIAMESAWGDNQWRQLSTKF